MTEDDSSTMLPILVGLVVIFCAYTYDKYKTRTAAPATAPTAGPNATAYGDDHDVCSICMGPRDSPVTTNCGHVFCASCFLDYADTRPLSAPPCPMCRTTVTMIMARHFGELMPVTQHRANRFNDRFAGGSRGLWTMALEAPVLLRHLFQNFRNEPIPGLVSLQVAFRLLASIVYFFLPVDLLPEAVFGVIGLIDDIFVALFLFTAAANVYRNWMLHHGDDLPARVPQEQRPEGTFPARPAHPPQRPTAPPAAAAAGDAPPPYF